MGVDSQARVIFGNVMHGRLFPKKNNFTYGIYYIALPLSGLDKLPIARNRFSPLSFYDKDHGNRDGTDLKNWTHGVLSRHGHAPYENITLICLPRVMGYVFNPVSFFLCRDEQGNLQAVLCEVHNTFGEQHTYLCAHDDHRIITAKDTLPGEKIFHVSPFLKREGHYNFRFAINDDALSISIDFYDGAGEKQLITSLKGRFIPMDKRSLRQAFWRYPLITIKAITLIHWQALKLIYKGIKYIHKPPQRKERESPTKTTKKN